MNKIISISITVFLAGSILTGCVTSKPLELYGTNRKIPLYLFTNMQDGETKSTQYPYDTRPFTLVGPIKWIHPTTSKEYSVYELDQYSKSFGGRRVQQYIIREDGQGLDRVYDTAFSEPFKFQELKFPLGEWFQGEKRVYGPISVTIRDINYGGNGGLQFDWERGNECWRYTYLMNKGRNSIQSC